MYGVKTPVPLTVGKRASLGDVIIPKIKQKNHTFTRMVYMY